MLHLYTGDGKGKTTAAVGLAARAAGRGIRVCFAQFMKGNESGEIVSLAQIPKVTVHRSNKVFGFYNDLTDEEKAELTDIHNDILREVLIRAKTGMCGMVILDELTYPLMWNLVNMELVKSLLALSKNIEIVVTGRNAADFLVEQADYITEMKAVRHPFDKGVQARIGIEY